MIEELFYNQSSNSMANGNTVRCHAMLDRKAQRRSRPNTIGRLRRFRMSAFGGRPDKGFGYVQLLQMTQSSRLRGRRRLSSPLQSAF